MCYSKIKNNPLETLRSKIHQDLDTWLDNILDPHAEKGQIVQSTAEFKDQLSEDILDTMDVIYQKSNPDSTPLPPDVKKKLLGHSGSFPEDEGPGVQKPKETFRDKNQEIQTLEEKRKLFSQEEFEEILGKMVSKLFHDILSFVQKQCEALWAWMKQALAETMEHVWKALKEFFSSLAKYFSGEEEGRAHLGLPGALVPCS